MKNPTSYQRRMQSAIVFVFIMLCGLLQAQENPGSGIPVYNVLNYGVKNDGITMNTVEIQKVIETVSGLGGGMVYFPPGKYLTGTIYLESHINLHIESGAVILGSLDIDDYIPVGKEKPNHSARQERHLIYAGGKEGVAITGRGTIHGRGYEFWPENFRTMTEIETRAAYNPTGWL